MRTIGFLFILGVYFQSPLFATTPSFWILSKTFISSYSNAPGAPSTFTGEQIRNVFLFQVDIVNLLYWTPSPDEDVVNYDLFRNGEWIAKISSDTPLAFQDHNRKKDKKDTYTLFAIRITGETSLPATLTLP